MSDLITIKDWAGNELFSGHYEDEKVDRVLEANRCSTCVDSPVCKECDGTGYSGDFSVEWQDPWDKRNVYEFINY